MMCHFIVTLCATFVASSVGLIDSSSFLKTPSGVTIVSAPFYSINLTWTFKYIGYVPTIRIYNSPEVKTDIFKQIKPNTGRLIVQVSRTNKTSYMYVGKLLVQVMLTQTRGGRKVLRISTVALQIVSVKSTSISTTTVRSTSVRSATLCSSVLKTSVRSTSVGSNSATSLPTATSCSSVSHRACPDRPEDDRVKTETDKVTMEVYIALIFIAVLFFTFTEIICVSVLQMRSRITDQVNQGTRRIEMAQTGMNLPEIECPQ